MVDTRRGSPASGQVMWQARRVLGEPCELWIRTGVSEDPGIAFCELTTTLLLERPGHDFT
jgi:hypothetical protein